MNKQNTNIKKKLALVNQDKNYFYYILRVHKTHKSRLIFDILVIFSWVSDKIFDISKSDTQCEKIQPLLKFIFRSKVMLKL